MLLGGDEIARTQDGNNNGWCQDNEISWFDWELDERAQRQLEFTQRLIALRRAHPVFHRRDFLTGEDRAGSGLPDAWWFRPDGRRMTQHDWNAGARRLGLFLNGEGITAPGPGGERVEDDSFLLLFNASAEDSAFNAAEPPLRQAVGAGVRHGRPDAGRGLADRRRAAASSTSTSRSLVAAAPRRLTWRSSARPTGSSSGRS